MSQVLSYRGYLAEVENAELSPVHYGSIADIDDGVYFEAESASDIENAFREAVDDYIAFCAEKGKRPERPA